MDQQIENKVELKVQQNDMPRDENSRRPTNQTRTLSPTIENAPIEAATESSTWTNQRTGQETIITMNRVVICLTDNLLLRLLAMRRLSSIASIFTFIILGTLLVHGLPTIDSGNVSVPSVVATSVAGLSTASPVLSHLELAGQDDEYGYHYFDFPWAYLCYMMIGLIGVGIACIIIITIKTIMNEGPIDPATIAHNSHVPVFEAAPSRATRNYSIRSDGSNQPAIPSLQSQFHAAPESGHMNYMSYGAKKHYLNDRKWEERNNEASMPTPMMQHADFTMQSLHHGFRE